MKKGDKIWIEYGFDFTEAQIVDIYNNGALVNYIHSLWGNKITWFVRNFSCSRMRSVEAMGSFKERIVKNQTSSNYKT